MATMKYKTEGMRVCEVELDDDLARLFAMVTERVWKHQQKFEKEFDKKSTINDWFSFISGLLTQMVKKPWNVDRFSQGALGAAAVLMAMLVHYKRNGGFAPRHYDVMDYNEESLPIAVEPHLAAVKAVDVFGDVVDVLEEKQAKRNRFIDKMMETSEDCPDCNKARMVCTEEKRKVDCNCKAVFYPVTYRANEEIIALKNPLFVCPKHGSKVSITFAAGERAKCGECGMQVYIDGSHYA